jgi:hypothetical protein
MNRSGRRGPLLDGRKGSGDLVHGMHPASWGTKMPYILLTLRKTMQYPEPRHCTCVYITMRTSSFKEQLERRRRLGVSHVRAGRDPSGLPPKLTRAQQRQVLRWFRRSPTSFPTELWTPKRVAQVIWRKWRIAALLF